MIYIYRFMLSRFLLIVFLLILVCGIFFTGCVFASSDTSYKSSAPVKITEGWEYRIGDCPINSAGLPEWIFDNSSSPEWKPLKLSTTTPDIKEDQHIIWLKLKLPCNITLENPSLYFKAPQQSLEAYIDGKLVYKSGKIDSTGKTKSYNEGWSEIPLNSSSPNKILYLRVYSYFSKYLGIISNTKLDYSRNFIATTLGNNYIQIVTSFFYIFIGFISLILFFIRKMEEKSLFFLSLFTLCLGLSGLNNLQVLFSNTSPIFWFYIQTIPHFFISVGICAFLEQVFGDDNSFILKYILWGYILFAILSTILDITNLVSFLYTLKLYSLLSLVAMPFVLNLFIKAFKRGDTNIKIVTFGIVCMCIIAIYNIIDQLFRLELKSQYVSPMGMFIFIIALIIVTCRRFIDVYDKLKIYSEEIEVKNATINETNMELEATNEELVSLLDQVQNTQAQLVQSEKMAALGGLVAGVAHEINTPLGISITATSFLQSQIKDFLTLYNSGKMKKSDLENCVSSLDETATMIMSNMQKTSDFVKSFKQIAVDQSSEEKRKFNAKEYIEEILLSLTPKLKKTQHIVTVNCADNIIIYSYPGALSQIITNLIMNSLIHAYDENDKGNITIDVFVKDKNLCLKYSDDGKGISNEIVHKIFDPFFTTKRGHGGTGLGLNIVYNIVSQTLLGSIKCESELGKGTTFIIEFSLRENVK